MAESCDPVRVKAELLRQMIEGEHAVDLRLLRFCASGLCVEHAARSAEAAKASLIDEVEVVDLAMQFDAPSGLLGNLRRDALNTLDRLIGMVQAPTTRMPR